MIQIRLKDRLGNQMFQYAFAYASSKKLNTGFRLDTSSHSTSLVKYFKLRKRERLLYHFCPVKKKLPSFYQTGNDIPKTVLSNISNQLYYDGYFQSEKYFRKNANQIKNLFTLKPIHVKAFQKQFGVLYKNSKILVIHVRRSDYLNHGNVALGGKDITLPMQYYLNCLKNADYSDYQKIVISDDLDFANTNFSQLPNTIVTHNPEIIDFQLIMNADVVFTANSSFSWWGAWLNQKPNKVIYAPNYWFGFKTKNEYPKEIIPDSWIKIDF